MDFKSPLTITIKVYTYGRLMTAAGNWACEREQVPSNASTCRSLKKKSKIMDIDDAHSQ